MQHSEYNKIFYKNLGIFISMMVFNILIFYVVVKIFTAKFLQMIHGV